MDSTVRQRQNKLQNNCRINQNTLDIYTQGAIQNIPDWCCHLYSRCGSTKRVDGRTTISNDSVCQVACRWVMGSFHTRLFGVMYVTCGNFHDGSEKGTAGVHQILCQSWEKCYGDPQNDSTRLRGPKLEFYTGVSMAQPVQDWLHISWWWTHRKTHKLHNSLKQSYEFNGSSVRIDIGPNTTLLRRQELVKGHASGFWWKN